MGAAFPSFFVGAGFSRTLRFLSLGAGFVLATFWLGSGRPIDASLVGGLVASGAAWQLVRPGHGPILAFAGGALAALWASLIRVQGVPAAAAIPVAAAFPFASLWLSQRRDIFAPPLLREEGLVAILALAVVVGVAPAVAQGWQSAGALNLAQGSASAPLVPVWMVSFVGLSTALGGLWSLWRRG